MRPWNIAKLLFCSICEPACMFIQMLRLLDRCGLLLCSSLHLMRESKQWGKWSWQQQHHSVKLLLTSCFPISDQILKAFLGLWMVRFSALVSWCLLIDCVGWQVHFNLYLQMMLFPTATIDYLHYIALVDNRLLVLFKVYLMCYLQVCSTESLHWIIIFGLSCNLLFSVRI